jgi:tellurite resistance protein TehA-like permease
VHEDAGARACPEPAAAPARSRLPADSFAAVMATGIVSVAARDNGHAAVSWVFALLAAAGLAGLAAIAAYHLATTGRAFAVGPDALTRTFGLFTFVAGCDVVDARVGPGRVGITGALGLVALAGWLVILPRLAAAFRSTPLPWGSARGSWLLAAVATHSLALTAAQLARAGVAPPLMLGLASAWWVLGLLSYLVITVAVVRRLLGARLAVELLTPDIWVLMGAQAIGTVAGGTLFLGATESAALRWLPALLGPVLLVVWAVGSAWVPLLVAAELRRARRVRPRFERARWSTVFPLGMYSAACWMLAAVLAPGTPAASGFPDLLRDVSHAAFWAALAVWLATATGLLRQAVR